MNLIRSTDELGHETNFTLDNKGNIIMIEDRLNRTTSFEYDVMNRLIKIADPDLAQTSYGYDEQGILVSITNARGKITSLEYDELNKLIVKKDSLGRSEVVTYDSNGNIESLINRNLQTITYSWDAENRLISKTLPGNEQTNYVYDDSDNLIEVTDSDSKLTMTYDGGDRVTNISTINSPSQPLVDITLMYDGKEMLLKLTDNLNGTTEYEYNQNDMVVTIIDSSIPNQTITYDHDDINRTILRTFPNGVITEFDFNGRSDLMRITNKKGANIISSFEYFQDNENNRTSVDQIRSNSNITSHLDYQYDNLNRLVDATNSLSGNPNETFTYDLVGNRLLKSGQTTQSVYDDNNQLLEDEQFIYSYDNVGNLIQKLNKTNQQLTQYSYDAENKLFEINNNGIITTYKYDGLGRRIEKNSNGDITRYVYRDSNTNSNYLYEFDGNNNIKSRYVYDIGADRPLILDNLGQIHFFTKDGLGSITELTDINGNIIQEYIYDSFGNIVDQTGSSDNSYTFTSREFDNETGLYYYRGRYYNSNLGRFITADPSLELLSIGNKIIPFFLTAMSEEPNYLNQYTYVANNPINLVDPSGLFFEIPDIPWPKEPPWTPIKKWLMMVDDDGCKLGETCKDCKSRCPDECPFGRQEMDQTSSTEIIICLRLTDFLDFSNNVMKNYKKSQTAERCAQKCAI